MRLNTKDIEKISNLIKLNFSQDEMKGLSHELKGILSEFHRVSDMNILEEVAIEESKKTSLRKDRVDEFREKERLFQNTKNIKDNHIIIPNIIGEI